MIWKAFQIGYINLIFERLNFAFYMGFYKELKILKLVLNKAPSQVRNQEFLWQGSFRKISSLR